ncbi:hypothetical protein [Paracoccus sanguinis]|uniref:hypothetical protein n=1 Tax=Paracoccus sanguinis TaxID=1545044 RepID=UPI000ABD905C|nr:hypothetical protein [Paracoccus sanguinis]
MWLSLMREERGLRHIQPDRSGTGASGLLADIARQIEHAVTGRYAALSHHATA